MANKEQFRNIARSCSQYREVEDTALRSEAMLHGEVIMSCENCEHFTEEHKCEINLIDEILSNMAEVNYD